MNISLGREPVAIIAAVVAVLQIVQELAISGVSAGVHGAIAVAIIILGAILARSKVTPVASLMVLASAAIGSRPKQ